jgi:hypothetical protein
MIKSIKRFIQRGIKKYDETINWDYELYFEQFIPEIEKFCNQQIEANLTNEYNLERMAKYKQMLILIQNWKDQDNGTKDFYLPNNSSSKMWAYFGKNIGWFNS